MTGRSEGAPSERAALLFDLDGTLVDSDAKHLAAFQRVFAPFGVAIDQTAYNTSIHGASNELIGRVFLSHLTPERQRAALEEKESAYRADLGDIEPISGAVELLDFAGRLGLECAVVTNGPRANAEAVLAALGLAARLSIVVIGAELERSKPDPLPYRRGLELTGAVACRSVAFEDSPTGVRSAAAAGLAVVGLTTSVDAASLMEAGATFVAGDFTDPRIRELIEQLATPTGQDS
jgi:beta-phosphoglucomutase-like phosphatase (HAD superfamily)